MISNYINHIALVVDRSGSMHRLAPTVVKVFDKEIGHLRQRSQELNQETRISVYLFDTTIECLVFDMDVMRMPTLAGHYHTGELTALRSATFKALKDLSKLPELYGDHAFLIYILTDGGENASYSTSTEELTSKIRGLPDNWTIACMVPNAMGVMEAKKFGFPAASVQVWSTTASGAEQMGQSFRSAMDSYMTGRAAGVRGTKSFFQTDLGGVSVKDVKGVLPEIANYKVYSINSKFGATIKDFIEAETGRAYVKGSTYYELTKSEKIQNYKAICIQNTKSDKVYGGDNARKLLGLPDHEVKVSPGDHGDWTIYVQSTSLNRKLLNGTRVLVKGAGV